MFLTKSLTDPKMSSSSLELNVDPMTRGLVSQKSSLGPSHALEASERDFEQLQHRAQMEKLRQMQGRHAPLRIEMERRALTNVGPIRMTLPSVTTITSLFAFRSATSPA